MTLGILNNHKSEGDLEDADVGGGQRGCPGAATLADALWLRVLTLLDLDPAPGALACTAVFRVVERKGHGAEVGVEG